MRFLLVLLVAFATGRVSWVGADEIDVWLGTIAEAGPQGAGSDAAREASQSLARQDARTLPRLLTAMETRLWCISHFCKTFKNSTISNAYQSRSI